MMADRELLELAAKAAGLVVEWGYNGDTWARRPDEHPEQAVRWNPLTDDGDALRLAVKLNLWLHVEEYGASARRAGGAWLGCEAHIHGGIEAATRRAIVRAAAAIGKER